MCGLRNALYKPRFTSLPTKYATVWTTRASIPGTLETHLFSKTPGPALGPNQRLTQCSFLAGKEAGV
jgi:hypothetical protein